MIEIVPVNEILEFRLKVLGHQIPDYKYHYQGDTRSDTYHLAYKIDDDVKGILTIMKTDDRRFQFRGMAVDFDMQGTGAGKKLIIFGEDLVKQKKGEIIWLNARKKAIPFYEKCGYTSTGEPFEIPMIGTHIQMIKQLF